MTLAKVKKKLLPPSIWSVLRGMLDKKNAVCLDVSITQSIPRLFFSWLILTNSGLYFINLIILLSLQKKTI